MANYRKLPFKNRRTGAVTFALDPAIGSGGRDNLMDGLPPMRFRGDPFLGDYNALSPGAGLSGTTAKKVVVRPDPDAAPGWAGFFDWIATESPQMYNYLRVSLPNFVEDRQSYPSAGSVLSGYGYTDPASILRGMRDSCCRQGVEIYESGNGLGDVTVDLMPLNAPDVQVPVMPAVEGVTNGAPLPTTTASSSIIDTIAAAAQAFLPLVTQQKLLNINVDRAAKGLPPIDTAAYESASAGLNVGANRSTQNTLLMLAAGIGGVFLLSSLLGKKR
jgi:hypothetical protein